MCDQVHFVSAQQPKVWQERRAPFLPKTCYRKTVRCQYSININLLFTGVISYRSTRQVKVPILHYCPPVKALPSTGIDCIWVSFFKVVFLRVRPCRTLSRNLPNGETTTAKTNAGQANSLRLPSTHILTSLWYCTVDRDYTSILRIKSTSRGDKALVSGITEDSIQGGWHIYDDRCHKLGKSSGI